MGTAELLEKARSLSRDQFVAARPNLYLILSPMDDQQPIGFQTLVAHSDGSRSDGAEADDEPQQLEVLEVRKAPGNPYPDRISLGRARNCDLVLRDASVSKLHAHFSRRPQGGLELVDLASQNGTVVDGIPLRAHQAALVAPGSTVRFGRVLASLVDAARLYDLLAFSD